MKKYLKLIVPNFLLVYYRKARIYISSFPYRNKNPKEVFQKIYEEKIWGGDDDFHSGSGSADTSVLNDYVLAIKKFCSDLKEKPTGVDLGCGDFEVGSRICMFFRHYTACDVVGNLIQRNDKKYALDGVDFLCLDATTDDIPRGDILIIRQVLQHLSNADIQKVLKNIGNKFKFWIVTEHIPNNPAFTSNLDKPTGPHIRMELGDGGSGVVLTDPPFSIQPVTECLLCTTKFGDSKIETRVYKF